MSDAEETLAFQLRAVGIAFHREFQFAPPRKWRAYFVIGNDGTTLDPILVEIDGGAFSGGRHTTGDGFRRDIEKANAAVMAGFRVLHFLPEQVESGIALATIERALGVVAEAGG